jgi:phage tail-like protein
VNVPTRHVLLRDRREWLGTRAGLEIDRDGTLTLARVPAPAQGKSIEIATTYPYARELSGLAIGPCDAVFASDTANDRVVYVDGLCDGRTSLGTFRKPRGLAFTAYALLVADSGNARIAHLALPALDSSHSWTEWMEPQAVAVDGKSRVLIVDAGMKRLRRVDADGTADAAFDAAIAATGKLSKPFAVAIGDRDVVLVSDIQANEVFVFTADGAFERALSGPPGWLPGATAASGDRVYVADAATGALYVFAMSGEMTGIVAGYRGTVSALAIDAEGNLFVKPGMDPTYFRLDADRHYVESGRIRAGPFDAGEKMEWERVWIDASLSRASECVVEVAQRATALPPPLPADWKALPASDALLAQLAPGTDRRFLWLRVTLRTRDALQSPRVMQVRAATTAEEYLDHLPATYARQDSAPGTEAGLLTRLLKLVRGEQSALEECVDLASRVADPRFAAATALPWLAQWMALELPQISDDDTRRALLERVTALFARRGTRHSIAEFVELHTGIRPTIVEGFEHRRVWVLGVSSRLDFDTQLPPLDPFGMVVADNTAAPECCNGPETANRSACDAAPPAPARSCSTGPLGRAVVGESGPLAAADIGMPLFAEDAHRFCVLVDGYRLRTPETLQELHRIIDREKPAHTDYRIEVVNPDMRVGLQARVGIDAIVGGDPPGFRLAGTLGWSTRLMPRDAASRVGEATLGADALTLI